MTGNTLEDIEREVAGSFKTRLAMSSTMSQLRMAQTKIGTAPLKILILGYRKLTFEEYEAAAKKFGQPGIQSLRMMERLSKGQKQYIFKQMGWPLEEVDMTAEQLAEKYPAPNEGS